VTEAQAYDVLGWPHVGTRGWFVLPLSGSDRTDWIACECPKCGYKAVTVPEAFVLACHGCSSDYTYKI
jgi:hypothetical protein